MRLPPELQSLITAEQQRRGINWLGLAPDICGVPVVLLTPRILCELQLSGNRLLTPEPATKSDIFDFLWRMHPNFRRPDGEMPNRPAGRGSALLAWLARRWIAGRVRSLNECPAELAIRTALAVMWQDMPATSGGERPSSTGVSEKVSALPTPSPHQLDTLCDWYGHRYGCAPHVALDVALPVLFQLRRNVALSRGETVIDPSQKPISEWLFSLAGARQTATVASN